MAKLLDHNLPQVPDTYDADTFEMILRDIDISLTKVDFPAVIEGRDDARSMAWFLN